MTFDWDDHCESNNAMPWMAELKAINPKFKATLFAIPSLGSKTFWSSHPDWIELVPHGWEHGDPPTDGGECKTWDYSGMQSFMSMIDLCLRFERFVLGFKAPGWQISDDCYMALEDGGWWVADQHLEDGRRPAELPTYFYEDGNWHGHVQNVCGNGLQETWETVKQLVAATDEFLFASEAVKVMATA